jgi:4-hydroxybenzoate polyprenyltransferase
MQTLKKWCPLISFFCGIIALVMICFPALKGSIENYNGLQVCFGKKGLMKISVFNTLTYVIALFSGMLAYLAGKMEGNNLKYIALVGFLVSMVLFFATEALVSLDDVSGLTSQAFRKMVDPAIGSIVGAIVCLLGAAATACTIFVKEDY